MSDAPYPPLRPQRPLRPRRRERSPLPMIIGIVLLVLLLIVLAFAVLGGDEPGAASGSSHPSASASSSSVASPSSAAPSTGAPSVAASNDPTASPAPDAIPRDTVIETTVERISVRGGPSVDAERLGSVELGTVGYVVDGPVEADGFSWYLLSAMGLPPNSGCAGPFTTDPYNCPAWFGWLAGRSENGDAWLAPHALDCPTPPLTAGAVILGRTNLERLACFGAEPITFRAFWPELPDDAGEDGSCAAQGEPSGWLYCQRTNDGYVTIDESDVGTTVSIDPTSGVAMPPRGTWIEMRIHLDDPAAEGCDDAAGVADDPASPERAVLDCRAQMVVESAVAVDGP